MIRIGIATHKAREAVFKQCLPTLLNQSIKPDDIHIYLNDYTTVPKWLKLLPVTCTLGKDAAGDIGAAAKLHFTDTMRGVYITADDDIIYDRRYVGYMADMVYRYHGRAIVGFHGLRYSWPVHSFYNDSETLYFYNALHHNVFVDGLGTGLISFHTGAINLHSTMFKQRNMSDAELLAMGKANRWPMLCLSREAGFLKEHPGGFDTSIWKTTQKDDTEQTRIINAVSSAPVYTAMDYSSGLSARDWDAKKWKIIKQLSR